MSLNNKYTIGESGKGFVIVLSILILLFIISKVYNNCVDSEIQNSKYNTVAQVDEIKLGAKNISVEYKFKINNRTVYGGLPIDEFPKKNLVNKSFKVHVSKTNPKFSKIFLDREILDTVAIKAAGFSFTKK